MFKQLPLILICIIYFHPVFSDLNHKHSYRVRHVRANSDLEVILNPGPMIAPSLIVGNFVDSKVNIEDAILEELGLATNNYGNLSQYISTTPGEFDAEIELDVDAENELEPDEEIPETSTSTTTTTSTQSPTTLIPDDEMDEFMQNMKVPDVNMTEIKMAMGRSAQNFEDNFSSEEISGFLDEEENEIVDDDSFFQTNDPNDPDTPCRIKLNDTSGSFIMNFSQDCTILLTTPQLNSRLVLHCENIRLANCSSDRDSLIVNVNGDLKFGRNSYFYCGPNSQVRATSIKQKISLRIRRTNYLKKRPLYQCSFASRTQRFFFPNLSQIPGSANQRTNTQTSCGRIGRVSKIVGGRRVPQGLFPWMAQLDITRVDGTHTACSGSIISENYILTAAHCLKNSESISVFMGGTDRREFTGSEVTVQAEKYILHRLWNTRTLAADLALIKLTEPVTFTQEISPICLLPKAMKDENWEGKIGVGAGWGRLETKEPAPRQLYRVRLPFLPQRRCARIYRRYFNSESMMCTDSNFKAAICYGDSGGPLMYKKSEKVYQLGIASFSLSKICGESPDVFTNVGEFETWIRSRIESNYY